MAYEDDNPNDVWMFPDDFNDVKSNSKATERPESKSKRDKDEEMAERVRKAANREEELKAKALLIANSAYLPALNSATLRNAYEIVKLWNAILVKNPIRESFLKTDGIAMRVVDHQTNTREFICFTGITHEIERRFCPEGVSSYVKPTKDSGSIAGMLKITEGDLESLFIDQLDKKVEKTAISEQVFLKEMASEMMMTTDMEEEVGTAVQASEEEEEEDDHHRKGPKDSYLLRIENAKRRGRITHLKMEIYADTFMELLQRNKDVQAKLDKTFRKQLGRNRLDPEPSKDIMRIISILNVEQLQLLIIAAEVPVCAYRHLEGFLRAKARIKQAKKAEAKRTGRGNSISNQFAKVVQAKMTIATPKIPANGIAKPVLFGTLADAIVYCPRRNGIAIVEYTTTTGDWNAGRGKMLHPYQNLENSIKNRKRLQLAITIEHVKQTYGPILIDNDISTEIYGYIIFTSPDGLRYELYIMPPHEQEGLVSLIANTQLV